MEKIILPYIKSNCHDRQFDVNHLTMLLNISDTYLRELTYKHYSQSPRALIEAVRLDKVLTHIESDMALIVISNNCGFGNFRTFRNAFEKRVGITAAKARNELYGCNNKQSLVEKWRLLIWSGGGG